MSHPAPNTSLSFSARLFCYLGPPSAILLTYIASPRTALHSPLALLPTAWLFKSWQASNSTNPSRRGELEPMIWTYFTAGTVGLAAIALGQMIICAAAGAILFGSGQAKDDFWKEFSRSTIDGLTGDELAHRAKLAGSWKTWVFNAVLTFVAAGLMEEIPKYLPIVYARRRSAANPKARRDRAYIDYALAGALGFGVVEAIGFLYAACEEGHESWPRVAFTLTERVAGCVGHLLLASLAALRATRRDFYGDRMSWWAVVGPSMLLHATADFVCLAASALEGNVGWIHPTGVRTTTAMLGLLSSLYAVTVWQVRREWKGLERRDRQRK